MRLCRFIRFNKDDTDISANIQNADYTNGFFRDKKKTTVASDIYPAKPSAFPRFLLINRIPFRYFVERF